MIYVFKTSVKTKKDIKKLKHHLNILCKQDKWNFDMEDCDKILRIDSQSEILKTVMDLLQDTGFDCEELL